MIHQLVPGLSAGDAIGNHAVALRGIFRDWGMTGSQIYAASRDARLADPGRPLNALRLGAGDWLIYHYGNASPVSDLAYVHRSQLILCYHNITPGDFFAPYSAPSAARLDLGRRELTRFAGVRAIADSTYNQAELLALGYAHPRVAPLWVDADGLRRSAASPAGQAVQARYPRDVAGTRWVNWLFVGRVAPNKRHESLIQAFEEYQRRVQPCSRLLIVGAWQAYPGYKSELDFLIRRLGVNNVVFAGQPSYEQGFGGFYAAADLYVSASEHEGFGVPLVEAMVFGLPIVARNCAGVPSAVGDGGLLVDHSDPGALAEAARIMLDDAAIRAYYAANQPARVAAHNLQSVSAVWRDAIADFDQSRQAA